VIHAVAASPSVVEASNDVASAASISGGGGEGGAESEGTVDSPSAAVGAVSVLFSAEIPPVVLVRLAPLEFLGNVKYFFPPIETTL